MIYLKDKNYIALKLMNSKIARKENNLLFHKNAFKFIKAENIFKQSKKFSVIHLI